MRLTVPPSTMPKSRFPGFGVSSRRMPSPNTATAAGLPASELAIVTDPVAGPVALGLKSTESVQESPPASCDPQFELTPKGPVPTMLEIVSGTEPEFLMTTGKAELVVPTPCAVKSSRVALSTA